MHTLGSGGGGRRQASHSRRRRRFASILIVLQVAHSYHRYYPLEGGLQNTIVRLRYFFSRKYVWRYHQWRFVYFNRGFQALIKTNQKKSKDIKWVNYRNIVGCIHAISHKEDMSRSFSTLHTKTPFMSSSFHELETKVCNNVVTVFLQNCFNTKVRSSNQISLC